MRRPYKSSVVNSVESVNGLLDYIVLCARMYILRGIPLSLCIHLAGYKAAACQLIVQVKADRVF